MCTGVCEFVIQPFLSVQANQVKVTRGTCENEFLHPFCTPAQSAASIHPAPSEVWRGEPSLGHLLTGGGSVAEHNDPETAGAPGALQVSSSHCSHSSSKVTWKMKLLSFFVFLFFSCSPHPTAIAPSLLFTPSHCTIQGLVTKSQ